ncbi:phage head morphogenesis protein [Macrococcoides goetzii]|uniref:Phage head morphogenesis protein n=1 Tax=Macrococcoides goetzii TaxID=1891097 RepID=A0A2G5NUR0_9STAP|nr:phage minor head protein [Macrococcus goetzii]RAI79677.1 phage head morphogenesis protein [Macrococcus goetzii]
MNQEQIKKQIEQLIAQTEKEIDKVWSERLDSILKILTTLYEKVSDKDGHVGWTEVNKFNRLNKELDMIAKEITGDYSKIATIIKKSQENIYLEAYLMHMFIYEFTTQKIVMPQIPRIETIREALELPIEYIKLLPTLAKQRMRVLDRIRNDIAQGIMAGEGFGNIAKRLRESLGMTSKQSKRVARTEGGRAMMTAKYKSAVELHESGIEVKKVWQATLDKRTRTTHRSLDGQTVGIYEEFESPSGCKGQHPKMLYGLNSAAENINCRCDLMIIIDGKLPEVRRAKNDDDESIVIPYMTYDKYKSWVKGGRAA